MRSGVDCMGVEWEEIKIFGKVIDITGQRFNHLVALFPVRSNKKVKWFCQCDCGNFVVVIASALKNGNTKSCGCLQKEKTTKRWMEYREANDVIGQKFGRLTVLEYVGINNQEAMYRYSCECGNVVVKSLHSVSSGNTSSCGCLLNELRDITKHDIIGQRFGQLVVVSYVGINKYGGTDFECVCDCGHTTVVSRCSLLRGAIKTCGCLRSIGENNIKNILDSKSIRYKQQKSFTDLISKFGGYPLYDFAILDSNNNVIRLIEFDGNQHNKPYEYFGGEEKFLKVQENDTLKNQYALSHNIPLVRIPYSKRDTMSIEDLLGDKYLI